MGNIWASKKGQKWRESFNGTVEREAKIHQNDLSLKPQFRGLEELLFRAELEILMNEFKQREVIHAVDSSDGDKARWFGEFVKQDSEYILDELRKRLANINLYPDNEQLRLYLNNVSNVIKAKLARGEAFSSIPFTGKNYTKRRGKSKKKQERKQGRKRPVMVNGEIFESMEAANKATGLGYQYIRYHADKGDSI